MSIGPYKNSSNGSDLEACGKQWFFNFAGKTSLYLFLLSIYAKY